MEVASSAGPKWDQCMGSDCTNIIANAAVDGTTPGNEVLPEIARLRV